MLRYCIKLNNLCSPDEVGNRLQVYVGELDDNKQPKGFFKSYH